MINDSSEWGVSLDKVINGNYIVASDLASIIKMNGLMTIGTCLKSIETETLQQMVDFIEDTYSEEPSENTCHEELVLIALLMSQAEGDVIEIDEDVYANRMHTTMIYLLMEMLYRKGMIDLKHENLSFDPACANRFIASATDYGKDFVKGLGEEDV